jgi:hypothetical protein
MMVVSYFNQIEEAAQEAGISLQAAYAEAGLPENAFYRHISGMHEPTSEVAFKVAAAIERLRTRALERQVA